jgi:hypothetical protein
MFNKKEVFALETVTMAILLGMVSWGGVEIFSIRQAIASIEVEQITHNTSVESLRALSLTLARVEEGQRYMKEGIDRHTVDLRDLSNHVRELHAKE